MARRKKKTRYVSKYADEAVYVVGKKVLKIDEQNTEVNDKMKTVFYCESTNPEGIVILGNPPKLPTCKNSSSTEVFLSIISKEPSICLAAPTPTGIIIASYSSK